MSISAVSGPLISYGQATYSDYNPEQGPSLFWGGSGILDPRPFYTYQPGQPAGNMVCGFLGTTRIMTVNQVPSTLSATNIAAAAVPVAGTPMTLVSSTGGGVTVPVSITNASTGSTVTGLLALDGAAGLVTFGSSSTIQLWDPTKALSRNIRITSVADETGATFSVKGYDIYGFPMSETITGVNNGIASGKKAFKYVASVTPAGTLSGSNVSVGTGDVFGFPLYSATWTAGADADVSISWNAAAITANTGYVAGVTSTATATTGDVRGTYAVQSASDGSKRLVFTQSPALTNIGSVSGLFGVTQF